MKIVVVGGDGRAHALQYICAKEGADVVVSGGNPGIPGATDEKPENIEGDLFIISPEAPLVDGLADRLRAQGKLAYGPGADGAKLEGSKVWMKDLVTAAKVPTAPYDVFTSVQQAKRRLQVRTGKGHYPCAVKTDGLAAGKGSFVAPNYSQALHDVRSKLSGEAFGDAGKTVIIEDGLGGREVSVMAVCDGNRVHILEPAQDYKRQLAGDKGGMTGGVGSYSPTAWRLDHAYLLETFFQPTLLELRRRNIDFRGTLYAGLMGESPYELKLLEYNVRFGDPEMEAIVTRITGGFVECLLGAAQGEITETPTFSLEACVVIALCSGGYPSPQLDLGHVIAGIEEAEQHALVFYSGVNRGEHGELLNSGGRVLYVVGQGKSLSEAREAANKAAACIHFDGMQYRDDIALDAITA